MTAEIATRNAERTLRKGHAPGPPLSLPYRCLARSCPSCGSLRTTPDNRLRRDSGEMPRCQECKLRQERDRRRAARPSLDETTRARNRAHIARVRAQAQAETLPLARNYGQRWTGPDATEAVRSDLTARELAKRLGRSFRAIDAIRHKYAAGVPRIVALVGSSDGA